MAGGHELDVDASRPSSPASPDELHRLALNLMENAIKHTPRGTHVRAAVASANGHVVLTVADDGPGVPDELRERIFERFARGTATAAARSGSD